MNDERRQTSSSDRHGFTLRDMFVVITVLAVVVGFLVMLLKSQQVARITSLRGSCINNMVQLGHGLQAHADAWKTLPPLYWGRNAKLRTTPSLSPLDAHGMYSWQVRLLPFIEEDTLYKNISASTAKFDDDSTKARVPSQQANGRTSPANIRVVGWQCPAVPEDQPDGNCNYVALSATRLPLLLDTTTGSDGLPAFKQEPDGMIIPDRAMRGQPLARMVDGASKTAVLIESREATRSNWYDPQQTFVVGFLPADTKPVDAAKSDYLPRFDATGKWQFDSAVGNRTALNHGPTSGQPKNFYHSNNGNPLERGWGPSSAHQGLIIVGMGDGSWKQLDEDIDPAVFYSLITLGGNENLKLPWDD